MLQDFGRKCAIVGRSERRQREHETSALVSAMAARAIDRGVTPIVCVGASLVAGERDKTLPVIDEQFPPVLELVEAGLIETAIVCEAVRHPQYMATAARQLRCRGSFASRCRRETGNCGSSVCE